MDLSLFNRLPPYGLIHNWLGEQTVQHLLDYTFAQRDAFSASQIGYNVGSELNREVRRSKRLTSLGEFQPLFSSKVQAILPAIFEQLDNSPFEPSHLEFELVAHGDGAFFTRHTDTIKREAGHRVVSAVYYFHSRPKGFSGGQLRLHSMSGNGEPGSFVDIEPDNDTLVFFPSWFPHEVLPVICPSRRLADSRFSVNCWIYQGAA